MSQIPSAVPPSSPQSGASSTGGVVPADIDRALWWVLSQPMHTAPSAGEVTLLPKVLDAAERFRPLSANKQADVIGSQRPPMPEPRLGIFAAA